MRVIGVDPGLAVTGYGVIETVGDGIRLVEAGVDHCGYDTTSCCVSILDLKSEQEAILVAGAIGRLHDEELTTSITPIRTKGSSSLLQRAGEILTGGSS